MTEYNKFIFIPQDENDLRLVEVINSSQKEFVDWVVKEHHSYVPTTKSVGRRIDYLIYVGDELCGMIGVGSATYPPCVDVLRRLNMNKSQYRKIFNSIANNWRFCLIKSKPNLGTQILKRFRKQCKIDWKKKYGDDLLYLMTFVGADKNGAVYKADNWEMIGYTSGLPEHNSVSMKWDDTKSISNKFVKPTGENRKMIFFKKI